MLPNLNKAFTILVLCTDLNFVQKHCQECEQKVNAFCLEYKLSGELILTWLKISSTCCLTTYVSGHVYLSNEDDLACTATVRG